ncbi:gliding motility lipoprotein GldH [Elizabethkingia argentiflava]|uniref:Gliding motility lipoprotein GldH n=1 Tax=Elizabethkingia argenteiflava TaxID=2681556 RepID=A0A845PWC4_9FLAO|nr:gliding motility lipoprotein GldH [Elizabethkingia argenteiflava]NAW50618.1 gliding motility lipoprotein GldH [Elizabethkingia argenteiflava]
MGRYSFVWILVWVSILIACISPLEQVKTIALDGHWASENPARFEFDIQDAQNLKNIIFVIRNNNQYPYMNLRLQVSISGMQEKKQHKDILNYTLARSNGLWKGSQFGGTKEILGLYKTHYRFPSNGKYKIEVMHLMNRNPLIGLEDIGIKIETVKP